MLSQLENEYIDYLERKLDDVTEDLTNIEKSYFDLQTDYEDKTQNSKPSLLKTLIAESRSL